MVKSEFTNSKKIVGKFGIVICGLFVICDLLIVISQSYAKGEENKSEPLIVNGDKVEYSPESKDFTAEGNVEVNFNGTKLTCDSLVVNSETKDGVAKGHCRLDDNKGVIEGDSLTYNFEKKSGVIIDAQFRANPYFGRSEKLQKVSDSEFISRWGYFTTCSMDNPHYRIKSNKLDIIPQERIRTRDNTMFIGGIPIMYLPQYDKSLQDPLMHVQVMAGKSKDWGPYYFSAWRYKVNDQVSGRIYADYRQKRGNAQGFGTNYDFNKQFGKGDFKFYYTQERDKSLSKEEFPIRKFERYFVRWRHKWDVDPQTNMVSEFYRIVDSKRAILGSTHNILKDYFPREYEKDSQPLSYIQLHRAFDYSSLDFLFQKRTNRWYSQEEKLPEVKYSLSSIRLGNSWLYLDDNSSFVSYKYKNAVPSPSSSDTVYNQWVTYNRISSPAAVAFVNFTPYVASQQTLNSRSTFGWTTQHAFTSGLDASTKFYRLFPVKTNFLKLDINDLRHIITPSLGYALTQTSTMPAGTLRIGGKSAQVTSGASLELDNKLQTKRNNTKIDLVDFRVTNAYNFKTGSATKQKGNLSDFLFNIDLLPYSWMTLHGDAAYVHSGSRDKEINPNFNSFSQVNYDFSFNFGNERTFTLGQRYAKKAGNQLTYTFDWRLNPKWKLNYYQRYELGHTVISQRGLREDQFTITRDLHCWEMDFAYNNKRGSGSTLWVIFRLKAFPELQFNYNKTYNAPKPGSQSGT